MPIAALKTAYLQACEIELQAFKPGNVSVYSEGHDMTVEQFRISAAVSVDALLNADYSLGQKIFYAVQATRDAVGCNTNLGIILLAAPLLQAAMQRSTDQSLQAALQQQLAATTDIDANWVFKAIALAAPGGLGASDQQDVNQPATVSLLKAMAIASSWDCIAKQYGCQFKDIFETGVLEYNLAINIYQDKPIAALQVFAAFLSQLPDSHVERKFGQAHTTWIQQKMLTIYQALHKATCFDQLLPGLMELDQAFKEKKINPGTSADLTVATVLAALLDDLFDNSVCQKV